VGRDGTLNGWLEHLSGGLWPSFLEELQGVNVEEVSASTMEAMESEITYILLIRIY
jgi:hypothetical protein